jgi:DNA-binding XRE family transcriptional regulator
MGDTREVLKCPHCEMTQFVPESRNCRRCHRPLDKPVPPVLAEPEPEPDPLPVARWKGDLAEIVTENLIYRRKTRKWSHAKLAKKMGVFPSYIYKIERGDHKPNLPTLQRYADAFGVPAYVLLIPSPRPQETTHEEVPAHRPAAD